MSVEHEPTPARSASLATLPTISRRGLRCYVLFLGFSLIGRVLFPYSDEPDFSVRSVQATSAESQLVFSPFTLFHGILPSAKVVADCEVSSEPLKLTAAISGVDCTDDAESTLRRLLWVVLITLPLGGVIIFRKATARILGIFGGRVDSSELNLRLDALAIAMLFPASVYYFGLLSVEPFVLSLGFLAFVVFDSWLLVVALAAYAMTIDLGNTVVMVGCYGFMLGFWYVYRRLGPSFCSLLAVAAMGVAYLLNRSLLTVILVVASHGPLTTKGAAILSKLTDSDFYTKYPLFLRPVVTFMTFSFMTPGFVKVPVLYVLFGCFAFALGLGAVRSTLHYVSPVPSLRGNLMAIQFRDAGFRNVSFLAAILAVVLIGILMPPYVNFKYYAFLLPFFAVVAITRYRLESVFWFCVLAEVLVFVHLVLYRYV